MSNKRKRKRPAGNRSSYRAPQTAQPQRRGLLDGLFPSRPPGGSPMPRLRSTLARGITTTLSIPWLVAAVPVVLLVVWELLITFGFEGPFSALSAAFSLPPITTFADTQIAGRTFRPPAGAAGAGAAVPGLVGFLVVLLFHAVINALVATASVERLRTGSVSSWAFRRVGRVLPVSASVGFVSLGLLIAGNILASLFGAIGVIFGLVGSMAIGIYLFGFAPAIAADEERRLSATLMRSVRAARLPGSANLWLAVGYVLVMLVAMLAPLPGSSIGVTPPAAAWAISILVNLMSVMLQSTLVYRYLVVAPYVPEGPPARREAARR